MSNELDQIMATCQEAYENAESYNAPPDEDGRFTVIVKGVKEVPFTQEDEDFVAISPSYEILDGPHTGWVMDGDRGLLGPASNNRVQMGLRDLKLLAKVLNSGKPLPAITDAVAIIKGSVGAQLIVEVTHGVAKKSGKPFANVRPKELLSSG